MTLKREVVSELGDDELLKPDLIAKSLVANDQVKYTSPGCRSCSGSAWAEFPCPTLSDLSGPRRAGRVKRSTGPAWAL